MKNADTNNKYCVLIYSVFCYVFSLSVLIVWILCMADLLDWGINIVNIQHPYIQFIWNGFLLLSFGIQHSLMARKQFKQWLSNFIPQAAERSTYILMTALVMLEIMFLWQPNEGHIWSIDNSAYQIILWGGFILGWGYMFLATFAINHFDLLGVRQAHFHFKGQTYIPLPFKIKSMYKFNRHPIQTGILLGSWLTPHMSFDHFIIATGMTLYIFIGVYFEEKDLIRSFGSSYQQYKKNVAGIIPWHRPRS